MPSQTAHLSDMRTGGHTLECYLSVYKGRLVAEATCNNTVLAATPAAIPIAITSGSDTDIQPGFRVDIFTSSGAFKGRTRVRYGATITANILPIRETSPGSISIVMGDLVKVYRDVRLTGLLPQANELFLPDAISIGDFVTNPPPWANSGGPWAGWADMLPALGTGSDSYVVDASSSGTLTHAWDGDGLTVDDGTAADVELTGAAGEYLVGHAVTDADNGKSATQYMPVIVHDADNPPYHVVIEDLPNSEERGGSARVRMLDNASIDDVPDGALVILWKDEHIAGVRQSFGARAPGRSHILLVGYLRSEDGEGGGETGGETLTFEVISPLARLDEVAGYSDLILNSTEASWRSVGALTVFRGILRRMQFYTTLQQSPFDFVFTNTFEDADYSGFAIEADTILAQVRELAHGTGGRLIEDVRGRFEVQMRPELEALANRAGWPLTLALTRQDVKAWKYTRQHWRATNRIEGHGFRASTDEDENTPLFSEWPGSAPGEGRETTTVERLIVNGASDSAAQTKLNELTGRFGAAQDGIYTDADGALQMALDLELTLRGVYDVFDLYDEHVTFDKTTVKRGIAMTGQRFMLISKRVSFESGTAETTLQLRTCTNGAAGQTYVPSVEDVPPYIPPIDVPVPPVLPTPPGDSLSGTSNRIAGITYSGRLVRTSNFLDATPVWEQINLTAAPYSIAGTVFDWVPDAYSPLYRGLGSAVNGWILTSTHIYRITDIFGAVGVASQTSFAAANSGSIQTERATPNYVHAHVWRTGGGGGSATYYTLNGVDWNAASGVGAGTSATIQAPFIYIDPQGTTTRAIFLNGSTPTGYVFNLTTGAWASASDPNFANIDRLGGWMTRAYGVPNVYYTCDLAASSPAFLKISGAAQTDISPSYSSTTYGHAGPNTRWLRIDDDNPNKAAVLARTSSLVTPVGLWLAHGGITSGASWVNLIPPNSGNYGPLGSMSLVYPALYVYGDDHIETINFDTGTRTDKSGNLSGAGAIINICGG